MNGGGTSAKWLLATVALLLLSWAPLGAVRVSAAQPTANEILDRMIARVRQVEERKAWQSYWYTLQFVLEKLAEDGSVKAREESVYEPVWVDGARVPGLVKKNGRPLSEDEQVQERKRAKDVSGESRRKQESRQETFKFDHQLIGRYHAEITGLETIDGREAYVLRFGPKGADLPERSRLDRLLNRVGGTIWVDMQEYEVVRAEGRLLEPVTWAWGVVASVQRLAFSIAQVRLDDTTWMPERFDASYRGRIMFSTVHERQHSIWRGYRKDSPPGAGASR